MEWLYNNKEIKSIEDFPEGVVGFVYKISTPSGKLYIGKKILSHSRRTRISKREKISTQTRKVFKTTVKESDWKNYYGSSEELKKDIVVLGKDVLYREILEFCYTKKYMTYCELVHQIKYRVLETDSYNGNILGKIYRKDTINER